MIVVFLVCRSQALHVPCTVLVVAVGCVVGVSAGTHSSPAALASRLICVASPKCRWWSQLQLYVQNRIEESMSVKEVEIKQALGQMISQTLAGADVSSIIKKPVRRPGSTVSSGAAPAPSVPWRCAPCRICPQGKHSLLEET